MNTLTRDQFVSSIERLAESVYDFHQRFDVSAVSPHSSVQELLERLRSRLPILMEEIGEHAGELNRGHASRAITEMADVAYVALGTLRVLDASGADACLTVAQKNDAKTVETHAADGTSGKLVRKVSGS